ncbi:MAG: hypothetical protein WA708_17695 [Acidobacteriaceae bacterium]
MLDTNQNLLLVILWVVLSMLYLVVLNRLWAPAKRRVHNDVIGWQISILGTIYAVMIGFMLYAVWSNFQTAESNAHAEANALVNLFRTAEGLPPAQRSAIEIATVNYSHAVVTEEWPMMHRAEPPHAGQPFIIQLWSTLSNTPTENYSQQASLAQAMHELSTLTEHRRLRVLESITQMPTILWTVLVVGGIITVGSCGLIGTENIRLHFVLLFALSLLISLALIAVGDIDRPFQGSVTVSPIAFVRAHETMLDPGLVPK